MLTRLLRSHLRPYRRQLQLIVVLQACQAMAGLYLPRLNARIIDKGVLTGDTGYIWSTGNNWSGPIKKFHLTIDKGLPGNLVSFCWDGKVTKTSPTTFEMEAEDWYPPWDRELEILILNKQNPEPNVG